MSAVSATCNELAKANLDRLPHCFVFKAGQPTYEAIQEIFWSSMAEITFAMLEGDQLPEHIIVFSDKVVIPVAELQWKNLRAELGLDQSNVQDVVREILDAQMRGRTPSKVPLLPAGETLTKRIGVRLLGFVLFACHIDRLAQRGPLLHFAYEFNELTYLARQQLDWIPVGRIDEGLIVREFFEFAGMSIRASNHLLRIPYFAFWRVLKSRLGSEVDTSANFHVCSTSVVLPQDFLLKALPTALPEPSDAVVAQPISTTTVQSDAEWVKMRQALLNELNRLRAENDRLRQEGEGKALASILEPFLLATGCPADVAEAAVCNAPEIARDLLYCVLRLLRSPELEIFGELGQVIDVRLPHPHYCLDDAVPPARRDMSIGPFYLSRRGLRYCGSLISRALVRPLKESAP